MGWTVLPRLSAADDPCWKRFPFVPYASAHFTIEVIIYHLGLAVWRLSAALVVMYL